MDKDFLLRHLPAYQNKSRVLVERQNVGDIMSGILMAHEKFKCDYDQIAKFFDVGSTYEICEKLWEFCKQNIPYNIEPDRMQSVRSPSAILAMIDGGDCKNYAQFVGGVLDSIGRATGKKIDWFYRFASYDVFDNTPEHVFVVVVDDGKEIWIDPVLKKFDTRHPLYIYKVDKKPKNSMALVMISGVQKQRPRKKAMGFVFASTNKASTSFPVSVAGVNCIAPPSMGRVRRRIGTTQQVGEKISAVAPLVSAVPVAALAVEAVGLALTLFGSKWSQSEQARWLIQLYQFYVLGNGGVTSDNKVNESLLPNAISWFSTVLGVPIVTNNGLQILQGANRPKGYPVSSMANDFLKTAEAVAKQVTYPEAYQAATIASTLMPYNNIPGSWANLPAAPAVAPLSESSALSPGSLNSGETQAATASPAASSASGLFSSLTSSPLLLVLLGGGAIYLLSKSKS